MDKFYVISNLNRDPRKEHAKRLADYLIKRGKSCGYCSVNRFYGSDVTELEVLNQIPEDTECAIILGGDGTIIQVAGQLAKKGIPLIGVNLGNLGFLAEIDKDAIYPAIDKILAGDFYLEDRMMLEGAPIIGGKTEEAILSLNDVVLARSSVMRVINYDIFINDRLLTTVNGDGVIVSTPTGSTGYSMSAGGPIVEPDSMVMLITPVSDHKLNSRPIVLSPDDTITIKIASAGRGEEKLVKASFDGGITYDMDINDGVIIKKADVVTKVIKISKESFLDTLARKFT